MVQVIEQSGDMLGRIGKGIGKGLSEQLPKEVERGRLSEGLKNKGFGDLSDILGIPGVSENPHLIPLIQQAQQRKAFMGGGGISNENQPKVSSDQTATSSIFPKETPPSKSGLASREEIRKFNQGLLQEPDQPQINSLARQLIGQGQYLDPIQAQQAAANILKTNQNSQNQKIKNFESDLNERMGLTLQSGGLKDYRSSIGEITQALLDQGKYDVFKKGVTPEAASKDAQDILLNLGKAMTTAKSAGVSAGSFIPGSGKNEKSRTTDLKASRKEFEKYGFGEVYDDLASSAAGITPMKAASILDPIQNKEFKKSVDKVERGYLKAFVQRLGDKDLDKIVSHINTKEGEEDNILSLEHYLREKRIDISDFKNKLLEPGTYNKLTAKQKRQLNKEATNSLFDDILFETF